MSPHDESAMLSNDATVKDMEGVISLFAMNNCTVGHYKCPQRQYGPTCHPLSLSNPPPLIAPTGGSLAVSLVVSSSASPPSQVNAMATASPEPLPGGEAGDEDAEEELNSELLQLPDWALQERLQRLDRGIAFRLPDGGKKYCDHHRALRRELARRQDASCSATPSPSSQPPEGSQGEPDDDQCERIVQSRCAESSDIQVTSSLPARWRPLHVHQSSCQMCTSSNRSLSPATTH